MKKIVLFILLSLLFTLTGCRGEANVNNTKNTENLYSKAISILDEFNEEQRVKDFLSAYELLMSLPTNEKRFVSQLQQVEQIFVKYDLELGHGDYYLTPVVEITKEGIDRYKSKGAYYDADAPHVDQLHHQN